jgi:GTP-binding protein
MVLPGERKTIAQGGEGGKGNIHFATSTRRSPRIATPGTAGEQRWVRLELRLVAEVGLVGLPNAGKSTLLRALTAARPKVAPYPFTTITPNLGRVMVSDEEAFSIADIPGLIEGAHLGQGLGIRFLRHVSRTSVLVYVLDANGTPAEDFRVVRGELKAFDPELPNRPSIVALNKMDLVAKDEAKAIVRKVKAATHLEVLAISADKHTGLEPLVAAISTELRNIETQKTQAACPS